MASQEEATVSPRGSPRNQKCGLNPNDPEDVRNFGGLLIDITTTKADYVLPFPITSLIIFILKFLKCYSRHPLKVKVVEKEKEKKLRNIEGVVVCCQDLVKWDHEQRHHLYQQQRQQLEVHID